VKITDGAMLERLIGDAKLTDGAQLERLLGDAKILDGAQLERLFAQIDTADRLERLLVKADDGVQLLDFLTKIGGAPEAANLERLFALVNAGEASRCQRLIDIAHAGTEAFKDMVDWTETLSRRVNAGGPAIAEPAEIAAQGWGSANMQHFVNEHMWEFLDIPARLQKRTTLWPQGMDPNRITDLLGEALRDLNPGGGHALPVPGTPSVGVPTAGGTVQVGSLPGAPPTIGQFFAEAQPGLVTITGSVMRAIWRILGP
jgi:hypothetical protein